MPVCFSVNNSREEYLRTKIGYIQQWQTPVEGNINKEKKNKKKQGNAASQASDKPGQMQSDLQLGNVISPLIDVYNKQTEKCIRERHNKSMHTSPNSIQIIFIMTLQIYMPNYGA